jgi:hypothetical protein
MQISSYSRIQALAFVGYPAEPLSYGDASHDVSIEVYHVIADRSALRPL